MVLVCVAVVDVLVCVVLVAVAVKHVLRNTRTEARGAPFAGECCETC